MTDDTTLSLTAQAEQNQIVARENRVCNLRHDGLIVADDAWKKFLARAEFAQEVSAHLVFDGAPLIIALFEFT